MNENNENLVEETKPFEVTTENASPETGDKTGWGKRIVTRRFLIAALAITVVTNAAVSAGALAFISRDGKAAKPEKIAAEDQNGGQSDNSAGDQFGNEYSDPYGNQNGDSYSDPFGSFGDENNSGYSDQYNNGYSDPYGNGYGDQYSNGSGDQYGDQYAYPFGDLYDNGSGDQNSNGSADQYDNGSGDQNSNGSVDQGSNSNQPSSPSIGIVISENSGVYIAQVTGNNAKKAGFAEGDKIVSIDGKNITNSTDLISEVQSHKAGDTVTIVVDRNGQSIEIQTVLE